MIAEGTFEVDVDAYYCFFGHCISKEVYTETKSICDRTACPIQVGKVKFEYLKHLPAYTPPVRRLTVIINIIAVGIRHVSG